MLNQVVLQGRLCADPELRNTPTGVAVANFRLAVDRDFVDKQTGQRECDFVNIVAWRGTAEFAHQYFTKGQMCVLSGRLQIRNYTDKEGNKRTVAEVVAEHMNFCGPKQERAETAEPYYAPAGPVTDETEFSELGDGDTLPF